jgi:hypothetical protein
LLHSALGVPSEKEFSKKMPLLGTRFTDPLQSDKKHNPSWQQKEQRHTTKPRSKAKENCHGREERGRNTPQRPSFSRSGTPLVILVQVITIWVPSPVMVVLHGSLWQPFPKMSPAAWCSGACLKIFLMAEACVKKIHHLIAKHSRTPAIQSKKDESLDRWQNLFVVPGNSPKLVHRFVAEPSKVGHPLLPAREARQP